MSVSLFTIFTHIFFKYPSEFLATTFTLPIFSPTSLKFGTACFIFLYSRLSTPSILVHVNSFSFVLVASGLSPVAISVFKLNELHSAIITSFVVFTGMFISSGIHLTSVSPILVNVTFALLSSVPRFPFVFSPTLYTKPFSSEILEWFFPCFYIFHF